MYLANCKLGKCSYVLLHDGKGATWWQCMTLQMFLYCMSVSNLRMALKKLASGYWLLELFSKRESFLESPTLLVESRLVTIWVQQSICT